MWQVLIKIERRGIGAVRATATRTDDISGELWSYTCVGLIDTPVQRAAMLQSIKDAWIENLANIEEDNSFFAGLADTATNSLNTWEATL